MKALIADDDAEGRLILKYLFERHGYSVVEAGDGFEALDKLKTERADIIISDGLMPRMDGFHFLRAAKSDDALKSIPFVFYSATYTGSEEVDLAISLGADAYIIKPKTPEEFWQELEFVIKDRRREKAVTARPFETEEEFLKKYSGVVAAKLEEKLTALETELKNRHALEEKSEFLASILQNIPEAVCSIDLSGNITSWNKGAERMLGFSEEEMMGKSILAVIPAALDGMKEVEHCMNIVNQDGYSTVYETVRLSKDGREIPVELTAMAIRDEKQKIAGYCSIMRDITERKEAEAEREARMTELEKFYRMSVGRELKMKELKEEIKRLKSSQQEHPAQPLPPPS